MEPTRGILKGASSSLNPNPEWWSCTLMRNNQPLEQPTDLSTLTRRYTEKCRALHSAEPGKALLPLLRDTYPHIPLFASKAFQKTSPRGLYGDVVEELDWSVGRVLETLRQQKLDQQTFVFFTSDNGPWLIKELVGGCAGHLQGAKAAPGKAACASRP